MLLALIALANPCVEEVFLTEHPVKNWHEAEVTAYTKHCIGCSGITASGKEAVGKYVAASKHWTFGTCLEFFYNGQWHQYAVEDRGGAIKSRHRFDLLFSDHKQAISFGRQKLKYRSC